MERGQRKIKRFLFSTLSPPEMLLLVGVLKQTGSPPPTPRQRKALKGGQHTAARDALLSPCPSLLIGLFISNQSC